MFDSLETWALLIKALSVLGTFFGALFVVIKYAVKFRTVESEIRMVEHCEQNRRRANTTMNEIANKTYDTARRLDSHVGIDHVVLDKRVTDLENTIRRFVG